MIEQVEVYPTSYAERSTPNVCLDVKFIGQESNGIPVARMDAMQYAQPKRAQFKPQVTEYMTVHRQPRDEPMAHALFQSAVEPVQPRPRACQKFDPQS
jgi:hypothetical protein